MMQAMPHVSEHSVDVKNDDGGTGRLRLLHGDQRYAGSSLRRANQGFKGNSCHGCVRENGNGRPIDHEQGARATADAFLAAVLEMHAGWASNDVPGPPMFVFIEVNDIEGGAEVGYHAENGSRYTEGQPRFT